jgi:hypothetical protein
MAFCPSVPASPNEVPYLNASGSLGRSALWIRHASFILMEKKRNEDKGGGRGGGLVPSRGTSHRGLKGGRSGLCT